MARSATVIAALKFESGVVIAADSQASDPSAGVRWEVDKLHSVGRYPLVVGFSGNLGLAGRVVENLEGETIRRNMFKKREHVRNLLDRCFDPIYLRIREQFPNPERSEFWNVAVWGLSAFWASEEAQILEYETTGDSSFHPHFHAVGSAAGTAYAVWRTLGGKRLRGLSKGKAVLAMVRILRTCVDVEVNWVSGPLSFMVVEQNATRELSVAEVDALQQYVGEWEEDQRRAFFENDWGRSGRV